MQIVKDGVLVENVGLRCKLGLHDWDYWHMAVSFIKAFPEGSNVNRSCKRCRLIQFWDKTRAYWQARI